MANTPKNIMLGKGVFKVDDQLIGLTRDGGNFSVEYENRVINADGDRGNVKGRIVRETAIPKLQISHLELLTSFDDMHSGIKKTTSGSNTVITGTGKIDDEADYHTVQFIGETKDGREVTIEVKNAINLENISLDLKEKNDVIDSITFTGCYEENAASIDEPWSITYANANA